MDILKANLAKSSIDVVLEECKTNDQNFIRLDKQMTSLRFDVLGIGNAIVDVISQVEDDFLAHHQLNKGAMTLIDENRSHALLNAMGPRTIISGGSAANTIVGVASFGLKASFIGKVKKDDVGESFSHDIRSMGVHFNTANAIDGPATAKSVILVTPDGERTMNTYLGACQNLTSDDVDSELIQSAGIIYLEGYLWDPPEAKKAFEKAAEIAHNAQRQVALTLSDSFCVDRYRDEFLGLMRSGSLDIIFANQHELKSLYQTSDLDTAIRAIREEGVLAAVTHKVPAIPIERLVDTTGAGDLYAAGFLSGLAKGAGLVDCARLGAIAAAEIIQHYGARPQQSLLNLANQNGLTL